jgi:hypothetical protein
MTSKKWWDRETEEETAKFWGKIFKALYLLWK